MNTLASILDIEQQADALIAAAKTEADELVRQAEVRQEQTLVETKTRVELEQVKQLAEYRDSLQPEVQAEADMTTAAIEALRDKVTSRQEAAIKRILEF